MFLQTLSVEVTEAGETLVDEKKDFSGETLVDEKKDFPTRTCFVQTSSVMVTEQRETSIGEKKGVEFAGSHEGRDVQIIAHTHCSMMRRGTHDTGTSEMQSTERGSSAHEHSARACGTDADCVGDVNSALTRGMQHTSSARTHRTDTR